MFVFFLLCVIVQSTPVIENWKKNVNDDDVVQMEANQNNEDSPINARNKKSEQICALVLAFTIAIDMSWPYYSPKIERKPKKQKKNKQMCSLQLNRYFAYSFQRPVACRMV